MANSIEYTWNIMGGHHGIQMNEINANIDVFYVFFFYV